ncbi:OmpA family protein [Derxia gummosa]|uniref:OmpA family protein n=1 Tax=Derxia gummosa DSM 723 TaxID=1121388 RepID=A0A8B6X9C6_9BURK|nr:OmpA family protein [Derxia gummosa]
MNNFTKLSFNALVLSGVLWLSGAGVAATAAEVASSALPVVDLDTQVPDPARIRDGLFPEDVDCPDKAELEKAGFKCMGAERPSTRFSLPAVAFRIGSAEIPEIFKRQLDAFATALSPLRGTGRRVRIFGHTDATGTSEANARLSQERAEAVRRYLIQQGVEAQMLTPVGLGSTQPKNSTDPTAPENRRVEIGR